MNKPFTELLDKLKNHAGNAIQIKLTTEATSSILTIKELGFAIINDMASLRSTDGKISVALKFEEIARIEDVYWIEEIQWRVAAYEITYKDGTTVELDLLD